MAFKFHPVLMCFPAVTYTRLISAQSCKSFLLTAIRKNTYIGLAGFSFKRFPTIPFFKTLA